jgi:hypothetical protein
MPYMSLRYDMVANYLHNQTKICQADCPLAWGWWVSLFEVDSLSIYNLVLQVCDSELCPGRTGHYLQMNWLSMRNNWLKLQTSGELSIILEESIEEYPEMNESTNRKMSNMYSFCFKIKVTFWHQLRYEIKDIFGEISLERNSA